MRISGWSSDVCSSELVTGASGGIGSAIATALAGQGARVAVSGSNGEKLEAFRAGLGGDPVALVCTLSDAAAVDALVPQAVEALGGKLDILERKSVLLGKSVSVRVDLGGRRYIK